MRILVLTQWFDPEPVIKGLVLSKAFANLGHEVHVITGFPNYPGGNLYPGYRVRPVMREVMDGIPVTRVPLYPSHNSSAVGRVLNYASFALSASIAGIFTRFRPDVVYVYHPPLTVGLAASLIQLAQQVPFVYDIQDLWPDTLEATGMLKSPAIMRMVGSAAKLVYRRAAMILAQSPGFVDALLSRGVPEEKLMLIYNWCDERALSMPPPPDSDPFAQLKGKFIVVFAGNMGKAQGLRAILDAASLVQRTDDNVAFVFVGAGTEVPALKEYAWQNDLRNVSFVDRVPMDRVGPMLKAADALLVHLRDHPLFTITVPAKTQAYLFCGKPIVLAVNGNGAEIVTRSRSGVAAKAEDPISIADAVLQLARTSPEERAAMGERGRRFYDEHMSFDVGTKRTLDALRIAVERRAARCGAIGR